jgi:hypothetical protein
MLLLPSVKRKKNLVYKNQGREPIHQKYKANESTSSHNQKKKKQKGYGKYGKLYFIIIIILGCEISPK